MCQMASYPAEQLWVYRRSARLSAITIPSDSGPICQVWLDSKWAIVIRISGCYTDSRMRRADVGWRTKELEWQIQK